MAAGGFHSLVLGSGGEVYAFDNAACGQLGHGDQERQLTPQVIKALKGVKVRAVAAGHLHSLVLSVSGEVYSFGNGDDGRLGHGDHEGQLTPKRIEAVANVRAVVAGDLHSMLLTEAGAVYSFGCGEEGQLGHSDMEHQSTPRMIEALRGVNVTAIAAGSATSLAVAAGRTAYGWGSGSEEDTTLGLGLSEAQLTPLQYPSAQLRMRVVG